MAAEGMSWEEALALLNEGKQWDCARMAQSLIKKRDFDTRNKITREVLSRLQPWLEDHGIGVCSTLDEVAKTAEKVTLTETQVLFEMMRLGEAFQPSEDKSMFKISQIARLKKACEKWLDWTEKRNLPP